MENNAIRLNIELIDSKTDEIEWQETLEDEFKNTFKLLDDISEKVINGLHIQFSNDEQKRMQKDVPQNSLSYEYYLRGVAFPLSVEGAHRSISILNQAKYLDSTYAPIFSEIGYRMQYLAQHELGSSNLYSEAEKYYRKSLDINPELLSALNELAWLNVDLGDSEEALILAKRALRINPNYSMTHHRLGYIYRYTGMLNESKKEVEKILKLDPTNVRFRSVGRTYLYLGEYSEALKAYEIGGESAYTYEKKGEIYFREGKLDLALDYFNRAINIEPFALTGIFSKAVKANIEQNRVEGLKIARLWEQGDPRDSEILYELASIYGLFGEKKKCSIILRRAIEGGFFCYPFMLRDEFLDPVRNDPEFQEVLALAKEKHEAFKQKYFAEIE
jgi:tetratricopeptide (TPR) repeat protein